MYVCVPGMCSFNPISSRIMDLDTNKELCKVNIILNSRINPIHMEKLKPIFLDILLGPFSNFVFVNNNVQQADAKVSSVTRKEKQ